MPQSRLRMCLCLLVVGNILLSLEVEVQAIPLAFQEELHDSYQNDEEFKREVKDGVEELVKNKGAMFDRILLVNSIHKRWKDKYDVKKRGLEQNAEDVIIKNNLENDNIYFEGDMILDNVTEEVMNGTAKDGQTRRKRNAVYQRKMLWTSRIVYYKIENSLLSESKAVAAIQAAIDIIHAKTCIRWVNNIPSLNRNYVSIIKGIGCYSKIGRAYYKTGAQELSIGVGCDWVAVVLHEMTHAMGFFHEQSRDDRDRYVKIIWKNIPVSFQDQFQTYSHGTIDKMGIDYNYDSIMHYGATAFGNNKVTIQSIDPTKTLGNSNTYTSLDVLEINALYDCKTKKSVCEDVHQMCQTWAATGQCEKNKAYMNDKCKASCGLCASTVPGSDFSSWSRWSECDTNCYKERQRFCFHDNKAHCPNSSPYGIITDKVECTANECPAPVDGNWANWAAWSACSQSCDEGKHQRSRTCNQPAPSNDGKFCIGESTDISVCLNRRCNIGPYDVDFEDGWGMWYNENSVIIRWSLITGPVKTLGTGALGDHTLQGQGNYIYVESSRPRVKGDIGRLASRNLEFTNPQCLSFYYTMYGEMMGSLTLWLVPPGGTWLEKFTKSGDQGTKWQNADITLDLKGEFQIVFEATLGGTGTSDIAIDDIFIDNGACPGYVAPTSPTTSNVCEDVEQNCQTWAATGACENNKAYMYVNCKSSCGLCPGKELVCEDVEQNCQTWAGTGECEKNKIYMAAKCKASCGLCPAGKKLVCEDVEQMCQTWAGTGECEKNKIYMAAKCKASCGLCPGKKLVCEDVEQMCQTWAGTGECEKNKIYMAAKCKASCGLCPGTADSCNDNNSECPRWVSQNECVQNPVWMGDNCKKSCGKC